MSTPRQRGCDAGPPTLEPPLRCGGLVLVGGDDGAVSSAGSTGCSGVEPGAGGEVRPHPAAIPRQDGAERYVSVSSRPPALAPLRLRARHFSSDRAAGRPKETGRKE